MSDLGFTESSRKSRRRDIEPGVKRFSESRQRRVTDACDGGLDGRREPFGTVVWKFVWQASAEQIDSDRA